MPIKTQNPPPIFLCAGGQCQGSGCIPEYLETVGHAELQSPRVVYDIRCTAYETGRLYRLRSEDVLPFLIEEARSCTSIFVDQYGSETDPVDELCDAFDIAAFETQGLRFFDDVHERQAAAWLDMMFCRKPPAFSKTPPRLRFPAFEGEYLRTTATVLRGMHPQESSLWGQCHADNDNTAAQSDIPA